MFQFFRRFFGIVSSKDLVRTFVFIYCTDNFFPMQKEDYEAMEKKKGLDLKKEFDVQEFKVSKSRALEMRKESQDFLDYTSVLKGFYCLDNRLKHDFIPEMKPQYIFGGKAIYEYTTNSGNIRREEKGGFGLFFTKSTISRLMLQEKDILGICLEVKTLNLCKIAQYFQETHLEASRVNNYYAAKVLNNSSAKKQKALHGDAKIEDVIEHTDRFVALSYMLYKQCQFGMFYGADFNENSGYLNQCNADNILFAPLLEETRAGLKLKVESFQNYIATSTNYWFDPVRTRIRWQMRNLNIDHRLLYAYLEPYEMGKIRSFALVDFLYNIPILAKVQHLLLTVVYNFTDLCFKTTGAELPQVIEAMNAAVTKEMQECCKIDSWKSWIF